MNENTPDFLVGLYETMVRIRVCEESLVEPILNGAIRCPCHLYSGQEAVATGVCAALREKDYVFGNHRSHGHYLAKGGDMKKLVAELYGKTTGCSKGRGGSMHLIAPEKGMAGATPIVGGTIALAAGAAMSSRVRGEDRVTVSFFGDGATGEGVFFESLNFAALRKLPIIFVCENNLYSTHMPIEKCRPDPDTSTTGLPFGIARFRIDGNSILSVYKTAGKAVSLCRQGRGPVVMECLTYRMRGHVGPDDNIQGCRTDIRPQSEIKAWGKKDPIKRFARYLVHKKLLDRAGLQQIWQRAEQETRAAHQYSQKSPYPGKGELKKYVFA